jgi:hypothetical protein
MSTTSQIRFQKALALYKAGDRHAAQKELRQVLLEDPRHVQAWLWMSELVDTLAQQRDCLERALAIDPTCEPAIKGLEILRLREAMATMAQQPAAASAPGAQQGGKIGDYLVERGLITRQQLEDALHQQKEMLSRTQGIRVPLGNILIKQGWLTPQMLATVLINQQQDRLQQPSAEPQYLGEYLVAHGLLNAHQLELALAEQARLQQTGQNILLGELLVYAGYITAASLEAILEQQRQTLFQRFGFDDDMLE